MNIFPIACLEQISMDLEIQPIATTITISGAGAWAWPGDPVVSPPIEILTFPLTYPMAREGCNLPRSNFNCTKFPKLKLAIFLVKILSFLVTVDQCCQFLSIFIHFA